MVKKSVTSSKLSDMSNDKPLVLIGEPGRIRGKLHLINTGSEEVVLQNARLRSTLAKKGHGKLAQKKLELNKPLHPIIIRPGRSRSVSVKMVLDPSTPPGEYDVELEAGGEVKPVKVHVIEKMDISLNPSKLIIRETPGGTVTKKVVIRNDGNVPVMIDDIGAVMLEDDRLECRILRRIVASIDTENSNANFEDHFRTAIAQIQSVLQQSGALRIHNTTGSVTLSPGATQAIELEIQLPKTLDKRSRYSASVPIYNRNLIFEIEPILTNHSGNNTK